MLTAMLRHLEIEASPVLVSTRDNGIVLFPSISNFDYVIVGVQTPTGFILLDATEEFSVPDILPLRDLNWFGRLIRENGTSEQIDLIPSGMSKKLTFVNAQLQLEGKISGKIKNTYTNYEAIYKSAQKGFIFPEVRQEKVTRAIVLVEKERHTVESPPEAATITTGENVCDFSFNIARADNRIQLTITQDTNRALVSSGFYPALREIYRKMVEKQQQKIVLKKA